MLFIRLLRFLRGYICFTAAEGFPERFLNLCNQAKVVIWEVKWQDGAMLGKTDRRGYAAMQACAEPAGVVLTARSKRGLPFFLYDYRRRAGLLGGLVFCIVTLTVLSGMIWTIEVEGNSRVSAEEILAVMEEQGLRLGVRRESLDAQAISEAAQQLLPGISWVSLNMRGSSAVVEVREELAIQPRQSDTPQDVVAGKAGQLVILEVYKGAANARPGQAVYPGSVLVGGVIENADATFRAVHAQGYAVARTSVAYEAAAQRQSEDARVTLHKTHYTLCFLTFRIPLGPRPKSEGGSVIEDRFTWTPGGKAMPLSLLRTSYAAHEPQTRLKTDRQLQLAACEAFFDGVYKQLRAAQVIEQEITAMMEEDACRVSLQGSAYENIGVEAEINNEQ